MTDVAGDIATRCDLCGSTALTDFDKPHDIRECRACGYVFHSARPTQADIRRFYSQQDHYDDWIKNEEARTRMWRRRLGIVLQYKQAGRLLDVGTGTGQFPAIAREYFEVNATEVSMSGIKIAYQRYHVHVEEGDLGTAKVRGKFDVITLIHVLEHVHSPSATLFRCRRLLARGGFLFVAVPNDVAAFRPTINATLRRLGVPGADRSRHRLPGLVLDGSMNEIHLSHFRPKTLTRLCRRLGFLVAACVPDPYSVGEGDEERAMERRYRRHCEFARLTGIVNYDTFMLVAHLPRS